MKAITTFVLLLFAFTGTVRAAEITPTFDEANAAFANGDMSTAISDYESILHHDGYSAPVLFNLGNAQYRNHQAGAAILSFERAQLLDPNNHAIANNLALAQRAAGAPVPALNGIQRAARLVTVNTFAWICFAALLVGCVAYGIGPFVMKSLAIRRMVGGAMALLVIGLGGLAVRWPDFNRGIITAMDAPARIAPASNAAESFRLKGGQPIHIDRTFGHFVLARTPDGRAGWVSSTDAGLVFTSNAADAKGI